MFKGKTIIITGASSGLGKALGQRFARQGANLALLARRKDELMAVQKQLQSETANGQRIDIFPCDVSDARQIEKAVGQLVKETGLPDMLVNNAGVLEEGAFEDLPLSSFKTIFDINYFGVVNCIKAVLPYFKKKGAGRIVNIASLGGKMASFGYSAYSSSKLALVGLTETLRMELKPQNIGVTLVCPGEFESPMVDELNRYRSQKNRMITQTVPVLPIDFVADQIISGLLKKRYLIIPGKLAVLLETIARWFPSASRALVDYKLKQV